MATTKKAFCNTCGTLEIIKNSNGWSSGQYETYEFSSPESMHARAITYQWVRRPSGKIVKAKKYSLQMCKNDWNDARYN